MKLVFYPAAAWAAAGPVTLGRGSLGECPSLLVRAWWWLRGKATGRGPDVLPLCPVLLLFSGG